MISTTIAGQGSINLVRSVGTYEYRTRAIENFNHNRGERDIRIVLSTPITVNVLAGELPELDPLDVQITYEYETRVGDVDFNGLNDIYLRRTAGGDLNNGVIAETVLRQVSTGVFAVYQATTTALSYAKNWSLADMDVDFADYNLDGYVDLYLRDISPALGATGVPDQMVISSGRLFDGQADSVVGWGESQALFSRDMRGFLEDPDYFDDAAEPDKDGYRITIDVLFLVCRDWFGWGFITCFSYDYEILVGEFSLEELGLDSFLGKTTKETVAGKPASATSPSITTKVHQAAAPVMSDLGLTSLVGTEAQKQQAQANMANPSSDPQTLWCVIWCGSDLYWYWDGYNAIYWADRWEPITIPGSFDDQNYSRAAYDLSLEFRDTGKILKEATEEAVKNEQIRKLIIIIAGAIGVGAAEVEEALEEIYDEDSGVPSGVARKLLEEMINALCSGDVTAQECIEIVEDLVIGDGDYDIGSIQDVLEEIFGPGILGEVNPEVFDEDWIEMNIPIYGAKVREQKNKPDRLWCTYWMFNANARQYFGRTSIQRPGTCSAAVGLRFLEHKRSAQFATYIAAEPDAGAPGLGGYIAIRGREQQLIDWALNLNGRTELPNDRVANRIRGVAKLNPFGCLYWLESNVGFGNIAPYTGVLPPSCP